MNLLRLARMGLMFVEIALLGGCVSAERRNPTVVHRLALAVAMQSGEQPTSAQWEALDAAITKVIGPGDRLIHDVANADEVVHLLFTPDPTNPVGGCAVVIAVMPNNRPPKLEPWNGVIDPETNRRGFELAMEAFGAR